MAPTRQGRGPGPAKSEATTRHVSHSETNRSDPARPVVASSSGDGGGDSLELTIVVPAYNEADRLVEGMRRFDAAAADGAIEIGRAHV